ncbi:MAG: hypothetical protein JRE58_07740 [Deltaproteobacteria bacterium]|nr:hypothetical protein [Deltaproteobacteria bacterium]
MGNVCGEQQNVRNEGGTILSLFADHRMTATSRLQFNEPMTGHFEIGGSRSTGKWWFA